MQLGLTWPLQRKLRMPVPYGTPIPKDYCWDAHCITLRGSDSLLLVHCLTRYTCVRFGMTVYDWVHLDEVVLEEIEAGLLEAVAQYIRDAGPAQFTRTHGRREVAYLNRAWEDALRADLLLNLERSRQPALNYIVNSCGCHCAAYEEKGTAISFLKRWWQEKIVEKE